MAISGQTTFRELSLDRELSPSLPELREQLRSILPVLPAFGSGKCRPLASSVLEGETGLLEGGKRRVANSMRLWDDSYRIPIGGRHGAKTYGPSPWNSRPA